MAFPVVAQPKGHLAVFPFVESAHWLVAIGIYFYWPIINFAEGLYFKVVTPDAVKLLPRNVGLNLLGASNYIV